jgi:hypothetical protein
LERAIRLKDRKPNYLPIANRFKDKTLQQVKQEIQQIQQRAFFLWQQENITTLLSDKEEDRDNKMSNISRRTDKPIKIEIPRRANPHAPTFTMSAKVTYPDRSKMDWKAIREAAETRQNDELSDSDDEFTGCDGPTCPAYLRMMERLQEEGDDDDDSSKTPSNTLD